MNNRFPLIVLAVAALIIATLAWKPLRSYAGLLSPWPTSTPTASPSPQRLADEQPAPSPTPEPETAPDAEAVPAEPEITVSEKCMDGSALTVTARDENQVSYKCGSGAVGARLSREGMK